MFETILEYQKLDGEILALKRSLEKDESKLSLNKVAVMAKEAQAKLIDLESKAKTLISDYNATKGKYDEAYTKISKLSKLDISTLSEEDATKYLDESNNIFSTLSTMERILSVQAENVNSIIKNFEICRNNIVNLKQKYKELKEKVDEAQKKLEPEIEAIQKKMQSLEKQIDANLLLKYKHIRQDKIFPVFVPLNNNACGGCSMELPAALMNKLKTNGYLECEQCRRYIYLES